MKIRKDGGLVVPFDPGKIRQAVYKALAGTGLPSESIAEKVTVDVVAMLGEDKEVVDNKEVQDCVEKALMRRDLGDAAKAYILYRDMRAKSRARLRVLYPGVSKPSITDRSLLLFQSASQNETSSWDRSRITERLMATLDMPNYKAAAIAKEVEDRVIASGIRTVSSSLIRELVNNILESEGVPGRLNDMAAYQVPREFIDSLLKSKSNENSNIVSNNPEAVNLTLAEFILKQYALDTVYSEDVKRAHISGMIYIHDLGYPHRVYCSSHSIEYIKKFGLKLLNNLNTESNPARSASVLTGHLNTFLASMQANYAGALGLGYINILYAPMLLGMDKKALHQIAQELVFNGSQNAFSRGGQTLFLDFNIHTGVPSYLRDVPAIGPGGKYMAKYNINGADWREGELVPLTESVEDGHWVLRFQNPYRQEDNGVALKELEDGTQWMYDAPNFHVMRYGDFEHEAQQFAHALLDVWCEGDARGRVFEFPKCDFHVNKDTFETEGQLDVLKHACRVAAINGSPYFVFDRDSVSIASCCRLRVQITDMSLLRHPERLRTCGAQNVTINIPQAAYRAAKNGHKDYDGICEEIDKAMDLAVQAHLQKKASIESMMKGPGDVLWQLGQPSCDGKPYLDMNDATYIIGLIGVNDAVQYLTGKQMHESDEAFDLALRITSRMFLRTKEYTKEHGIQFKLEESPAESAARRLARSDLQRFREDALKVYKGGDEEHAYYTNSIHIVANADVDSIERIDKQSMFNSLIEAGAITHLFTGDKANDPGAIETLVTQTYLRTQCAQLTISPEFTYCNTCGHKSAGIKDKCDRCGSSNVVGETRIVGYYSKVHSWNDSKKAELKDRQRGNYAVKSVEGLK